MPAKTNHVNLSKSERKQLKELTTKGETSARKLNRARVLLLSDESNGNRYKKDEEISKILEISKATVYRIRERFCKEGLESTLKEKPRSGRPSEITGRQKAKITVIACTKPPEGYGKWSLRLLKERVVELDIIDSISHTSIKNILKKTN